MICHVLSYVQASACRYPDRIALADAHHAITYAGLWQYVTSFGSVLTERLKVVNRAVAVCLRHDMYDILAFFAIAYSGNFYVPVDTSLPVERVKHMLTVSEPVAVLTRDGDRPLPVDCTTLSIPAEVTPADGEASPAPWQRAKDTDPLYLIYTSGSTGVPKGVLISHRSVIDMAEQFCGVFAFDETGVFGNQAPFDFDVSVKDIYLAMKVGGRLEILEKKLFSFPKLLIERMNERKVNTIIWAVPALKIMAELDAFAADRPQHLRDILFSGEMIPQKTLGYWREKYPDARFVNLYGPTEITCNCTYHILHSSSPDPCLTDMPLPIGKAFPNCTVLLLDGDRAAEEGEIGEICVTGSCLALGYYNAPEQTASAFVPNPLQKAYREPLYRTGDMGRMENGLLYYMGRADTQIKHMGHRIELAEIELSAGGCDGVDAAACVYDGEGMKIHLFYKGTAGEKDVFKHLRGKLPKYMLPGVIEAVTEFPQTRTGKIDRKALLTSVKNRACR